MGFFFLQAVCLTVCMDQDEDMTFGKLQSSILDHMEANVDYYQKFHTGNVLKDMKRYFKFDTYCNSIVDIIVIAMARALNMNLKIYQERDIRKHTNSRTYNKCNRQGNPLEIYT